MSNSNTVPWLVAVVATAIGAGAIGYFARPYIEGSPVGPVPQSQQQQAASGQLPPNVTTEQFGDWQLLCQAVPDKPSICFAVQDIKTPEGQLVLNVLAGYEAKGNRAFIVRAPLGVDIAKGVTFRMPTGKPIDFAFTACSQVSCDAQLEVPGDGFAKLEEAGSFELSYVAPGGDPVVSKISMKGLSDAFVKIVKPEPVAAPAPAVEGPSGTPAPAGADTPTPTPKPATP